MAIRSFLLAALLAPGLLLAEHPACHQLPYDFTQHQASDLRDIAAMCSSAEFSNLNYHRAYYQDLRRSFHAYSQLGFASPAQVQQPRQRGRAYGLYIQLAEVFVPIAGGTPRHQATRLSQVYEQSNEIAELRLKGYGARADWLESQRSSRTAGGG